MIDELEELQREYRAGLPPKVEELTEALAARDRKRVAELAHRLRGTAGSYGLAEVSAAAGAIEDRADAAWEELAALVATLRATAEAAR